MAAWAALVRACQHKVVLVENSHLFKKAALEVLIGDMYNIEHLVLDGRFFGWLGRRPRFYAVCTHKSHCAGLLESFANVIPMFHRVCRATFHEFFIAESAPRIREHLDQELLWAASRRTSYARMNSGASRPEESDKPFLSALTVMERKFLDEYIAKGFGGRCCQLNQSAGRDRGIKSGVHGDLHSLLSTPAVHFLMDTERGIARWLDGFEMLLAQGFPVLNKLSNPRGDSRRCCSFGEAVLGQHEPTRHRQTMVRQAGNAMQLCVVGAVLIYVFSCVRFSAESPRVLSVGDLGNRDGHISYGLGHLGRLAALCRKAKRQRQM